LILTSDREKAVALEEKFHLLGQYTGLKIVTLLPGHSIEGQKDTLAEGADIVIGTPDRVQMIYYKSGLNINKLKMFILDDADLMIKQGFQTVIKSLTESLPKCQHIVYTEVLHSKLESVLDAFMNAPASIEISDFSSEPLKTIDLYLYSVPNFKTKQNLIQLLMRDTDTYSKNLIFVNTKITAESVYKSLAQRNEGEVVLYKPADFELPGIDSIAEFMHNRQWRILIASNDQQEPLTNTDNVPFVIHFDIPENKDLFVQRVLSDDYETTQEKTGLLFSTDIELSLLKKIEQALGFSIPEIELPLDLIIEGDKKKQNEGEEKQKKTEDFLGGGAFHEKKPENAKDYNHKYMDRLKMFGKKNRKNKRGES
jgi:ATP-dependent RNA helicase RhlE